MTTPGPLDPDQSSVTRGFGRDVGETYATQLLIVALSMATTILLARALGPGGRGTLQIGQVVATELALLATLGLPVSIVRATASRSIATAQVAAAALLLSGACATFVATVIILGAPRLADVLADGSAAARSVIRWGALIAAASVVRAFAIAILRGALRFRLQNAALLAGAVVVIIAVAVVAGSDADAVSMARAIALALLVSAIATVVLASSVAGFRIEGLGRVSLGLLRFNLRGHAGSVLQQLSYRLDVLLVGALLPIRDVGVYAVALAVGQALWYLPDAVGTIVLARSGGQDAEADARLAAVCQVLTGAVAVSAVLVALSAPMALPAVFGRAFDDAVIPLLLLLPGVVGLSIWKVLVNEMAARGAPEVKLRSALVGAVATIALDLTLIPRFGVAGAAAASSCAYLLTAAAMVTIVSRRTALRPADLVWPRWSSLRVLADR